MLKNSIFLLVILILVTACSDTSEIKSNLIGKWQVESKILVIDFERTISSPLDIERGIEFISDDEVIITEYFEDGTYVITKNESLDEEGTYKIINQEQFEWNCKGEYILEGDKFITTCEGTQDGVPAYTKTVMRRVTTE